MQGTRTDQQYKRGVLLGINGTGKSSFAVKKIFPAYDTRVHKIVVITETDPPCYDSYPRIHSYEKLAALKAGVVKFFDYDNDENDMLEKIISLINKGHLQNGLFVFEDCSNYILPNVQPSIKKFIGNHRMYHLDLLFTVHSFFDLPPYIRRRASYYTIFKTADTFRNPNELRTLRYPNADNIYAAWVKVMNHPNRFENITIKSGV